MVLKHVVFKTTIMVMMILTNTYCAGASHRGTHSDSTRFEHSRFQITYYNTMSIVLHNDIIRVITEITVYKELHNYHFNVRQ